MDSRELRRQIESMFPNANGEEISLIMELFITAGDAEHLARTGEE